MRRARGFTLVELMVVIAIIAFVGAAAAMMTKSVRGDTAPAFARSALAQHHEARHAAIALGQWTRVRLDVTGTFARLVDERLDPITATWVPLGGSASAPHDVQVCAVAPATVLGAFLPGCPAAAKQSICFSPAAR
jgi:prepilin-type N-terminal cleavage/methylation domain-containing protein